MPYTTNNFATGQTLTAKALNRMDNQIAAITTIAEQFTEQKIINLIKTLQLKTDGQYVTLMFGDTALATVPIGDISQLIPCTGLSLTSSSNILLDAGSSQQLSLTRQPTNCNQNIQYLSSDISIATVNSSGMLKGVSAGKAIITAICGGFSKVINASIAQVVKPTWFAGNHLYVDAHNDRTQNEASVLDDSGDSLACLFPSADDPNSKVLVRAGMKVVIECIDSSKHPHFESVAFIAPKTEDGFEYETNWSNRPVIESRDIVADLTPDYAVVESVTYTAGRDCYPILAFKCDGLGDLTDEKLKTMNDIVRIRVMPGDN